MLLVIFTYQCLGKWCLNSIIIIIKRIPTVKKSGLVRVENPLKLQYLSSHYLPWLCMGSSSCREHCHDLSLRIHRLLCRST